jgi:hypothetical protein
MLRFSARLLAAVSLCASMCGLARADVLLNQTNIVGLPTVAAPSKHAFTVTTAAALTVTLQDFQQPAAFGALQVAVTLGDTLVGSASIDASGIATVAVPAAAGNYTLYVVGTPDSTQGFGSFGVCVSLTSDTTHACIANYSYSDSLTTPNPPSSTGTLNTLFTSTTAGTYTITVTDDALPVAFSKLSAGIFLGSTPIAVNIPPGTPTQITLAAATQYKLLAAAIPNTTTPAGLYGIRITDPSGAAIFDYSLAVGAVTDTVVSNPTAGALSLTLTDFGYPAALATVGAAVTAGGGPALGTLTAAGGPVSTNTAPAGSIDVWTYAAAGTQPGAYGLTLTNGTSTLLSTTQVVNPSNASSAGTYAFVVTIPAAGTYQLAVTDFQFPGALASLSATIAQNGTVLTQSAENFTAAAGAAIVVVDAQPPQSGSGIFDVSVQTTGATPQILLDQTQAVAGVFNTQTISLGTTGGYNATLTDLVFPQKFQDLAIVVSQGGQALGKIYGGGSFGFTGTPGSKYLITFVATPNAQSTAPAVPGYGLYSLNVASTPPTVTFTSSASSVSAGGTVTLTWSSQNAVSCTASGGTGWTGSQMTSGTLAVAVAAAETLTLSCTGPGGTIAQSVALTITPPASGGSHGGGAIDLTSLLALLTLWVASYRRHTWRRDSAALAEISRSRRAG